MIYDKEVFRIGVLGKTHGVRGEISFLFDNDIFDQIDCPYLVLKIEGIFVPFFMDEYRFKGKETALITFQDINSEDKAAKLQGLEVFFPREYGEQDHMDDGMISSWNYFIGFTIIDKELGILGVITDVDTQTLNSLFLISRGNGNDDIMIPATEDFILGINDEKKEILLQLPEGMIE